MHINTEICVYVCQATRLNNRTQSSFLSCIHLAMYVMTHARNTHTSTYPPYKQCKDIHTHTRTHSIYRQTMQTIHGYVSTLKRCVHVLCVCIHRIICCTLCCTKSIFWAYIRMPRDVVNTSYTDQKAPNTYVKWTFLFIRICVHMCTPDKSTRHTTNHIQRIIGHEHLH
jgi:hypothetical protein